LEFAVSWFQMTTRATAQNSQRPHVHTLSAIC
jgi:hypothetical protein